MIVVKCWRIVGIKLIKSEGQGQSVELIAQEIKLIGLADPEAYPIQPKKHTLDFLRKNAHLRFRTKTFSSIFRIRHALSFAIHNFFNTSKFYYIQYMHNFQNVL